jgi:hypothetical protein
MAPSKDSLQTNNNILASSGLSSKTITGLNTYRHGSVAVIEIAYSGGTQYIKVKQNQIEVGGTNEWGTGTIA